MVRHALAAARNAFLSRGFALFGLRFACDYLRIAWYSSRHWGATHAGMMRILGYRVPYTNHSDALFLFHEIFVNAMYAFGKRRGRPHVIDCGANIGMAVVFFRAYAPAATIVAIEPAPGTFDCLRRTIEINGFKDVELVNAAVSRTDGTLNLYATESKSGSMTASLYRGWAGGAAREVPAIRLSRVIDKRVDFLKLDVEGAEYDVVEDLVDTGVIQWIAEAVIECHELEERPGARDHLMGRLREAGLDVRVVRDDKASRTSIVHGVARNSGVQSGSKRVPATRRTTSA